MKTLSSIKTLTRTATAAVLLLVGGFGVVTDLGAVGAKAWVTTSITDWTITPSAGELTCNPLISGANVAAASGDTVDSHSVNPPNGLDPAQSFSGEGSAPGQNTFTQTPNGPSLPNNAGSNYFARGDSLVPVTRDAATVVAESQINRIGGANSNATHNLNCALRLTQAARVTFSFNASRAYHAMITSDSALGSSSAQVEYNFFINLNAGETRVFNWSPDGFSGVDEVDPFALNGTVSDNIPDNFQAQGSSGPAAFSVTTPLLQPGEYSLAVAVGSTSTVTLGQKLPPPMDCQALNVTEAGAGALQATLTQLGLGGTQPENEACHSFVATYNIACSGDLTLGAQGPALPAGCSMAPDPQSGNGSFTVTCDSSTLILPGQTLSIGFDTAWSGSDGSCLLQLAQPFTCIGTESGDTIIGDPGQCSWLISRPAPPPLALACNSLTVNPVEYDVPQLTRTSISLLGDPALQDSCDDLIATYQMDCSGDFAMSAGPPVLPVGCTMDPVSQNAPGSFIIHCPQATLVPNGSLTVDYTTRWTGSTGGCQLVLKQDFSCLRASTQTRIQGSVNGCSWFVGRPPDLVPALGPMALIAVFAGLALLGGMSARRRRD